MTQINGFREAIDKLKLKELKIKYHLSFVAARGDQESVTELYQNLQES